MIKKLILILFISSQVFGTIWYVDPSASGANDGSNPTDAFESIFTVSLNGSYSGAYGDTILLKTDQSYKILAGEADRFNVWSPKYHGISLMKYGSGVNPIIDGGDSCSNVIYMGSDAYSFESLTMKNITVTGSTPGAGSYCLQTANGSDSLEIDSCEFDGQGCVGLFNMDYAVVRNSTFKNSIADEHGVYISGDNNLVENCFAYNNFDSGFKLNQTSIGDAMSDHNIFRYNWAEGNGVGILVASCDSSYFYYNVVIVNTPSASGYGNQHGIVIEGNSNATTNPATNNHIYNNTIIAQDSIGSNNAIKYNSDGLGNKIKNNIIYTGNQTYGYATTHFWSTNYATYYPDLQYNMYYRIADPTQAQNKFRTYVAVMYETLALWQAEGYDLNSTWADPKFTNMVWETYDGGKMTNSDLTLDSLSTAIDAGDASVRDENGDAFTVDYDGNPIDGTIDIGAFEWQSTGSVYPSRASYLRGGIRIHSD